MTEDEREDRENREDREDFQREKAYVSMDQRQFSLLYNKYNGVRKSKKYCPFCFKAVAPKCKNIVKTSGREWAVCCWEASIVKFKRSGVPLPGGIPNYFDIEYFLREEAKKYDSRDKRFKLIQKIASIFDVQIDACPFLGRYLAPDAEDRIELVTGRGLIIPATFSELFGRLKSVGINIPQNYGESLGIIAIEPFLRRCAEQAANMPVERGQRAMACVITINQLLGLDDFWALSRFIRITGRV